MSKTIKNSFKNALTFEKFIQAHQRAKKNKSYKKDVIMYELNLENNIINLMQKIKTNTYRVGKYYAFKVFEPKERIIHALPYEDRIVHQWYVEEFIKPHFIPRFINSTFACIENRGVHKAVDYCQSMMRQAQKNNPNFWVLKCDIKKFFYNIDPLILMNIMRKNISDKLLLKFTYRLIFSGKQSIHEVGIPIGNYTSQYFANIYMNELDQYVKHTLKIKYYCRYMDDFLFILKSKKECISIYNTISNFLKEHLHLELNAKSRYYPAKMGINFCGYRIFTTHRLLRNSSKTKIKNNVKKWNKSYEKNNLNIKHALLSINAWIGHSSHCNSYKFQQKILNNCNFLVNTKTNTILEQNLIDDINNYLKNNKKNSK
ncbi:MAG: reverse transcriptase/maturase family protein [Clostridia bacterium]